MTETIEKIRRENKNYLARDKKCNALDLALMYFYDYVEDRDGETEHEQELLRFLEKEVNQLRYTIECYKNELADIHYKKIEELKGCE